MKKALFSFILATFVLTSFAQVTLSKREVPRAVMNSYLSQNSNGVKDSVWTKEEIAIYKVKYVDNGQLYEANYFTDGSWIKTYAWIQPNQLPDVVIKKLNEMYPQNKIEKCSIELNSDGKFYVAYIIRGSEKSTLFFTMSGKFVK